jgi:hypothetical protein
VKEKRREEKRREEKRREEKRREEKRREEKSGVVVRHYIWGGQETVSPVLKVPRQCPFVSLVEISHMIGINYFYMMLEGLH